METEIKQLNLLTTQELTALAVLVEDKGQENVGPIYANLLATIHAKLISMGAEA